MWILDIINVNGCFYFLKGNLGSLGMFGMFGMKGYRVGGEREWERERERERWMDG